MKKTTIMINNNNILIKQKQIILKIKITIKITIKNNKNKIVNLKSTATYNATTMLVISDGHLTVRSKERFPNSLPPPTAAADESRSEQE